MTDIVDRLRRDWPRPKEGALGDLHEAADEIERLRLRAQELEAALKPFMWGDDAVCEILFGDFPDEKSMTFTIPLRDFRRARAALRADGAPK